VVRPPTRPELDTAVRRLGTALRKRNWQLASAESCTGGLIGHLLTEQVVSSEHYLGGIVSYSTMLKGELLGVASECFARGSVSSEVAEAMARGALERFAPAHLALAVTCSAGPDPADGDEPVGLTYAAVARRDGRAEIVRRVFPHDRPANKRAAALLCLELACEATVAED
jgi:PncC family amidohydrolase